MAYNFNAVNDSLQEKANIFAPSQGATDNNDGQQQNNVFQTSAPMTGGSPGSNGGGGVGGGAAKAVIQPGGVKGTGSGGAYNPSSAQKAYDTVNVDGYKSGTDKISGKITTAETKLQDEANAYTQKADETAETYKVDNDTLTKAADGSDAEYQKVAQRLSQTVPTQFDAFEGLKAEELPDQESAIAKPSLFGDIFNERKGSSYSAGDRRLNSMLLGRNDDFRNIALQLGGKQEQLYENNAKMQDELTETTRDKLNTAYTDATGQIRSTLNEMGEVIIKTAKDQEIADEARRQGLDVAKLSAAEFEKLKPQILAAMKAGGLDRSTKYLDDASNYGNLKDYLKLDTDVDYTDFIDQQGADKYNRIGGLLGRSGNVIAPTAKDDDYSFDQTGAQSYINSQTQGLRQAEDRDLQSQFDAVQAQAQGRISGYNQNPVQALQDYINERYMNANEGQSEQELAAEKEAYRQMFQNGDLSGYWQQQGKLTKPGASSSNWADYLSGTEAQKLSQLSKELGQDQSFGQGSMSTNPGFDQGYFNDNFESTFKRILGEMNGTVSQTTGTGMGRDTNVNQAVTPKTTPISASVMQQLKAKYPYMSDAELTAKAPQLIARGL